MVSSGAPQAMESSGAPHRRATIVDVARAADVSRQTVSNAVNNPHRVAPSTLLRVHREIDRLGFRTNVAARSLRNQRAHAWGIELNSLGVRRLGNILDEFLVALTVASRAHEAHLVPFAAAHHGDPIPAYQDMVAHQLVDGFLLTDTRLGDPRPGWLQERRVPFTAFGRVWDDPQFHRWVDVDGFAGVATGVRHLLEQGYAPIGFLGWPPGSPVGDARREGWRSALRRTSTRATALPTRSARPDSSTPSVRSAARHHLGDLLASSPQDVAAAARAVGPVIDQVGRGGAVICASDTLAMGAWSVLRERGLRPGVDIGLVGFDDTDLAQSFGLTSLRQPLTAVVHIVLAQMDDALQGLPPPAEGVLLEPELVVRASSTRIPRSDWAPSAAPPIAGDRSHTGGNQ